MPTFGQFETVRPLYSGPRTTVYLARRYGSKDEPKHIVKAMESLAALDQQEAAEQSSRFLGAAGVYKSLTDAGAKYWSVVHDVGTSPAGVYYVTDLYPTTVAKLLDGQVRLSGRAIHHIASDVIEGLLEIQSLKGRSHGALRPTRVLLSKASMPERAKVALTTPAASPPDGPDGEFDDVRAVGRMLYQMVFLQPFRELGGWPIPESDEFAARFGDKGDGWRALLNRMLNPSLRPGELTLAAIGSELGTLRPPAAGRSAGDGGGRGKLALIALAGLALVGGVGYVAVSSLGGGSGQAQATDLPNAEELVERFYGRVWVMRAVEGLGSEYEELGQDPWWAGRVSDPIQSALASATFAQDRMPQRGPMLSRRASPDRFLTGPDDPATLNAEDESLAAVIEGFGFESWPALVERAALADRIESAGFGELAGELRQPENVIRADAPVRGEFDEIKVWYSSFAKAVESVVADREVVLDLGTRLDRREELRVGLSASDDPILARYPAPLDASESLTDLNVLAAKVGEQVDVGNQLLSELSSLDESLLDQLRSQPLYAAVQRSETVGNDVFVEWLELVSFPERWQAVEMPSWVQSVRSRADQLLSNSLGISSRSLPGGVEPDAWRRASSQADSVEQDARGLLKELDELTEVQAEERGPEGFRSRLADLEQDLKSATDEQASLIAQAQVDADESRAAISALQAELSISDSVAIDSWWTKQRDAAIERFGLQETGLLIDRTNELRDVGADIAHDAKRTIADEVGRVPEWVIQAELAEIESAQREALYVDALSRWSPGMQAESLDVRTTHQQWLADVATTLSEIDAALSQWSSGLEGPDALVGTIERLGSTPVWEQLEPALESVVLLRDRIEAIDGRDVASLLSTADNEEHDLALRLLAWEQLGKRSGWPRPGTDVRRDASLAKSLLESLEQHGDQAAARAVGQRVRDVSAGRIEAALASVTTDGQVGTVAAAMAELGIRDDQIGDAEGRYNLLVHEFRQAFDRASGDEEAQRGAIGRFVSRSGSIAAALPQGPRESLDALREALEQQRDAGNSGGGNLAGAGPGSRGWTLVPNDDPSRPVYRPPNGGVEIAFRRLSDGQGGRATYMGETEVSIAQFNALIGSSRADRERYYRTIGRNLWRDYPLSQARLGDTEFQVWEYDDGSGLLVQRSEWVGLEPIANRFDVPIYSDNPCIEPGRPGKNTPMTSVSAFAADIAAALTGCRLPTSEEWATAARASNASRWNLRDQTVANQIRHVGDVWDPAKSQQNMPPGIQPQAFTFENDTRESTAVATQDSDGELWFWDVDEGPDRVPFKNIVGNVAEFVNDRKGDRLDPANAVPTAQSADFKVIGASALSLRPATEATDLAWRDLVVPYADVGFRLVFEAEAPVAQAPPPEVDLEPILDRLYTFD